MGNMRLAPFADIARDPKADATFPAHRRPRRQRKPWPQGSSIRLGNAPQETYPPKQSLFRRELRRPSFSSAGGGWTQSHHYILWPTPDSCDPKES